jgi:hypothetical protein
MMTGTPGAVRPNQAIPTPTRRTGLIRMALGSQHEFKIGDTSPHCEARDFRTCPDAKHFYFCLHAHCVGKQWATHEEMRKAHPDTQQMAKAQEAHVYGLWSEDVADPKRLERAKAALKKAEKDVADCAKLEIRSLADKDAVREYGNVLEKAQAEALGAACCLGLIAPPEQMVE